MNLPRSERFKTENIILVGVIPGPSEPKLNINTYLSPLVDELLILWNDGVMLHHHGSQFIPETFKASLLCVACDIPASRKVCGFTQGRRKVDNGGGGADIHIFMFTDCKNNRFQRK
jgi:hypothetical protein